jgi:hypothetical protein
MISLNGLASTLDPLVAALLRSPLHGIASKGLMVLCWTGRESGRRFDLPVGYQRDGSSMIVLISKPNEKRWWRNFREPWPAELRIRGRVREATGVVVEPGSDEFFERIETTLRQLPWVGRQLGIEVRKGEALNAAQREVLGDPCGVVRFEIPETS